VLSVFSFLLYLLLLQLPVRYGFGHGNFDIISEVGHISLLNQYEVFSSFYKIQDTACAALFVVAVRVPSDELFGFSKRELGHTVAVVLLHVFARVNVFAYPQAHVGAAVAQRASFALYKIEPRFKNKSSQ